MREMGNGARERSSWRWEIVNTLPVKLLTPCLSCCVRWASDGFMLISNTFPSFEKIFGSILIIYCRRERRKEALRSKGDFESYCNDSGKDGLSLEQGGYGRVGER